ncbi:hypothetical protein PQR08_13400 [Caballeronia jiangsuensis]|uniref:SAM-dependent methyltransferase n=1 Tax=Caballeronia jiangsuensis TaxID=1458357 RepID=A0ABW9CLH0_9BURK
MSTDFLDAHQRHWDDAEHLLAAGRWANADHLYGLSAECGLKRLMIAFGMETNTTGVPKVKKDKVHVDEAWDRYESYRSGHCLGANYPLPLSNAFDTWNVSQRYDHRMYFDQAVAQAHRAGADTVKNLISQAQQAGVI